jgi:hypothetical protein
MKVAHFILIENGERFYLEATRNEWALTHGLEYDLLLQNGNERRAVKLLKTVAYVAIDEAADGSPVLEKWLIRGCSQFNIE